MNTIQRLLSNTAMAFAASVIVKAGNALLFILIGRQLGPTESGIFSLGTTYFTIVFGLSALGIHELMVREVSGRRGESGRYLVNFLSLRLLATFGTYGLLILGLRVFAPYSETTQLVILILSLAAIPEAIFDICQSLFEAHERLQVPFVAAVVSSSVKILAGLWLLSQGAPITLIAWVVPVASVISLFVFAPGLVHLFRGTRQSQPARLNLGFLRGQMAYMPSFFVISLFSLLDYQADALLISLILDEKALGYFAAAQTILLAFNLIPLAVRTAIYPLMSRYHHDAPDKLAVFFESISRYLIAAVLPLAAGVTVLAEPIVTLIFGQDFGPAVPVLQISIWAIALLLINEPHARLILVYNKQQPAARILGVTTAFNILTNLLLIPRLGINGAAIARLLSNLALYISFFLYTNKRIMPSDPRPMIPRPLLATGLMVLAVWPLRSLPLVIPIAAGVVVYGLAGYILGIVPPQDLIYWREIIRRRT